MTDRIADLDDVDEPGVDEPGVDEPAPHTPTRGSWWSRHRERRRTRVSRWDRPPAPHDWRFFVGTIGKVLIATGMLMFGFVAYQLWGTGIETARAQNQLEDAFEQAVATRIDDEPAPATTAPDITLDTAPDTTSDTTPEEVTPTTPDTTEPRDDEPLPEPSEPVRSEIVPGGVDLSGVAVDQEIPAIEHGDVIARLEIPRIDQDLYVVAGVTLDDLKNGPGHYPETPLPGQLGNAAIAGHRTTYGAPFFDVDQLTAGDQLIVTMITGDRFVYEVTGAQVVSASDYWVVTTRDPNVAELTLTSCHPKYTARDRLVIHSVLVPELSSDVGFPEFYEGDRAATEAIAGDDPTLVDEESGTDAGGSAVPDDEVVATVDPDAANDLVGGDEQTATEDATGEAAEEVAPAATQPAVDEPADELGEVPSAPEPGTVEEPEQIDAFSQGWFHDDEAWPQIALWGIALTIISLLAYQVSKKTRHDSIGVLVGIGPFLFCLYFFFQNVNRLLPPGV